MGVFGRPLLAAEYKVLGAECYSLDECTVRGPKSLNVISSVQLYLFLSAISGFRHEANENYALLGNYAANSVICRRFGRTYRSHLQGSYIYSYFKFGYNFKKMVPTSKKTH